MKREIDFRGRIFSRLKSLLAAAAVAACTTHSAFGATLTQVFSFGTNPGNLLMYKYVPASMPSSAPVVVLLHGCSQSAASYDDEPGWVKFANQYKFYLVFAQQQTINNSGKCFNWFAPGDHTRGQGEALSIKQMVDKIKATHSVDANRVYVSGLSGGAAMTAVMLAAYPDVFAGGAINAGIAYKCATSSSAGFSCMYGLVNKTPQQWGDLARSGYSGYTGRKPLVAIFNGTADSAVNINNLTELMEQWTNYHGISQTPTTSDTLKGYPRKIYGGKVMTVEITGMDHGTAIDPGTGADQCGVAASYFIDVNLCSTYYSAKFWGLF
ncbi:MAG: PHB depolymerase family esterase [Burkholderiales bacterium]|nr:PHB depolymerase family esterase [Burkholderiales bacterium]